MRKFISIVEQFLFEKPGDKYRHQNKENKNILLIRNALKQWVSGHARGKDMTSIAHKIMEVNPQFTCKGLIGNEVYHLTPFTDNLVKDFKNNNNVFIKHEFTSCAVDIESLLAFNDGRNQDGIIFGFQVTTENACFYVPRMIDAIRGTYPEDEDDPYTDFYDEDEIVIRPPKQINRQMIVGFVLSGNLKMVDREEEIICILQRIHP